MSKVFYKCRLMPCEEGLSVYVKKFISAYETPCFHFCIEEHNRGRLAVPLINEGENNRQALERMKVKVFRVAKSGSRVAFETEQEAYEQLVFLKRRQLAHLNRDIEFLNAFINYGSDRQFNDIPFTGNFRTVPNSQELVSEHYVFD